MFILSLKTETLVIFPPQWAESLRKAFSLSPPRAPIIVQAKSCSIYYCFFFLTRSLRNSTHAVSAMTAINIVITRIISLDILDAL